MSMEPTPETGVTQEAAAPEQNAPAPEQSEEKIVPLSALEAERAQRQQLQDELSMIKDNLNMLQARQIQTQQQAPQQPQYDDDDVLTFGDFKKMAGEFQRDISGKLTELDMKQQYPDYVNVVTKYLPEVLKTDPALREDLQSNPNYYRAYYIAKNSEAYRKDHEEQKRNADAERMIENAQRPGSLSQVGGVSPINTAKRYRDMSDDEFRKEMAKNVGYV